ncbi:hypothetical protein V8C42DRAFT_362993 [Trichoderma barbatum]
MCLVIITRCLICFQTMQCNVIPCRKVIIAHQTCGERHQAPDNISDVMCDNCYRKTQPEIPAPSLKDKAKYYAKKFSPSGGSSSQANTSEIGIQDISSADGLSPKRMFVQAETGTLRRHPDHSHDLFSKTSAEVTGLE